MQRWVLSVLAATTILHLSGGLAIAGIFSDEMDARVGLNVLAAVTGVAAVVAFRGIHGKSMFSPWLLLGLVPGIVGLVVTFR